MNHLRFLLFISAFGITTEAARAGAGSRASWLDPERYRDTIQSCLEPGLEPTTGLWLAPLNIPNRQSWAGAKISGNLNDFRSSARRGHRHTGIDATPGGMTPGESFEVLAAASGIVCGILLDRPQQTVIVRHRLPDRSTVFTVYKHLAQITVRRGQTVTGNTPLGYTEGAEDTFGPEFAHVHFEVRRSLADGGSRSYTSMSPGVVARNFMDPLKVIDFGRFTPQ